MGLAKQASKILYLEGVRGICASAVVFTHCILCFYPALYYLVPEQSHMGGARELSVGGSLWSLVLASNYAVPLLFVLSSYVLTYRYFRDRDAAVVRASAWRRYVRLVIPNAFSVLVCYVFMKLGWMYNLDAVAVTLSPWAGNCYNFSPDFLTALKQGLWDGFFTVIPAADFYNPATWTMLYEMGGSFFVFSFLLLFGRSPRRWIVYAVTLALFGGSHFLAFIFGMMIADVRHSAYGRGFCTFLSRRSWLSLGLLALGFLFTGYFGDSRNICSVVLERLGAAAGYPGYDLRIFYHDTGAALMLLGILFHASLQRFLHQRWLVFIGGISYSMYLIHMVLLCSVGCRVFLYFFRSGQTYSVSVLAAVAVCSVCIVAAAYGMMRLVDQPAIRLARYLQRRFCAEASDVGDKVR